MLDAIIKLEDDISKIDDDTYVSPQMSMPAQCWRDLYKLARLGHVLKTLANKIEMEHTGSGQITAWVSAPPNQPAVRTPVFCDDMTVGQILFNAACVWNDEGGDVDIEVLRSLNKSA